MNSIEKNKNFCEENQNNNDIAVKKKKKRAPKRRTGQAGGFFMRLADAISRALKGGLFGFLFADIYTQLNEKWRNGAIYSVFHRKKRQARSRARLAHLYESSITRRVIVHIGETFVHSYVRVIGVALFGFAFSSIFMAMLRYYLEGEHIQNSVVTGIILALLSVPLTVSKKRVGEALLTGKLTGFILTQILSIDEGPLQKDESKHGGSYLAAFEIAMILGFVTYFIPIVYMLVAFMIISVFIIIMCFPELGILSVIAIIPFVNILKHPSLMILFMIMFTSISFLSKYIRGKRIMRFELIDIIVLMFAILILFGGIFSRGGNESLQGALVSVGFLCIYFLIVNSYIRKTWIYRVIKLIVVSTSLVALAGIFDGGMINPSWVDAEAFANIGARVTSFLGNPNMLGAYLVVVFPFVPAQMLSEKSGIKKVFYFLCSISVFACIILTWSRGAWLGVIVALAVFLVLSNFRNIWIILLGAASVPAWMYLLPDSILERFSSIFAMSDSSVIYRFNTWRGVWQMILDNIWHGIGFGESAFKAVYPSYAVPGTETVMHSHNVFMQIVLELGILGGLIFVVAMFMFLQKCLGTVKSRRRDSKSRLMAVAGLSGITGSLVMGLTDHIWYNYRVFLIFWIVIALMVSLTKINEREKNKAMEASRVVSTSRSAELDIVI